MNTKISILFIIYIILIATAIGISFMCRKNWVGMFDLNRVSDDTIATIFQIRLNLFAFPFACLFYYSIIFNIDCILEDLENASEDGPNEECRLEEF